VDDTVGIRVERAAVARLPRQTPGSVEEAGISRGDGFVGSKRA
jgi:hypothetical protein